MQLEYFSDPTSDARPVLLLFGDDPGEAKLVRDEIYELALNDPGTELGIDRLRYVEPVDGSALTAVVGMSDRGLVLMTDLPPVFRCELSSESWLTVADLIDPFTTATPRGHQYLTDQGPIDWIISSAREW